MTTGDSLAFGVGLVADAFPAIRAQFEKGFVQRWALDPWSRGAFPVFKPGEMSTLMPTIARAENGIHFADYIRRVDVTESAFAFELKGRQQMRYLSITPKRSAVIKSIELVKGPDRTAPIVMAVTIETP